jgi:large subunit ribosomal protein L16
MLQPKRTKYRKVQKGKNRGTAWTGSDVSFGDFGLQVTDRSYITARQIEACRMAIQRHVKRQGKLWIRVFPDKPLTKKPLEVRMGSGKGSVELWVAVVKPGKVLFEMAGVPEDVARGAFEVAATKLPVACRFLARGVL